MTTGIYLLEFADGIEYVGQAVDIERRWEQHRANMWGNKAANKMQQAFKKYGMPSFSVLVSCHKDHLNLLEAYYIQQREPLLNTVVETVLSDWELEMVGVNLAAFRLSILEMLEILANTETKVEEEHASVTHWVARYAELEEARKEEVFAEWKDHYESELEYAASREAELEAKVKELEAKVAWLSRPWWKKLFG